MTDAPDAPPPTAPPLTGHPAIDEALAAVVLTDDVHTHHDALAAALEPLQRALKAPAVEPGR